MKPQTKPTLKSRTTPKKSGSYKLPYKASTRKGPSGTVITGTSSIVRK